MAKFYGKIGYGVTVETEPGIFEDQISERSYFGDILSKNWRYQSSESRNDDINLANRISIIADTFAYENFNAMRYVEFMGAKWKISDADASQYPRLILTTGGVYNGE